MSLPILDHLLEAPKGTAAEAQERAALAILRLQENGDFQTLFKYMNHLCGGVLSSPFVDSKGKPVDAMIASTKDGQKAFPRFIFETIISNYKLKEAKQ